MRFTSSHERDREAEEACIRALSATAGRSTDDLLEPTGLSPWRLRGALRRLAARAKVTRRRLPGHGSTFFWALPEGARPYQLRAYEDFKARWTPPSEAP